MLALGINLKNKSRKKKKSKNVILNLLRSKCLLLSSRLSPWQSECLFCHYFLNPYQFSLQFWSLLSLSKFPDWNAHRWCHHRYRLNVSFGSDLCTLFLSLEIFQVRVAFIVIWLALFVALPVIFNRYKSALAIDFGILAVTCLFVAIHLFFGYPIDFSFSSLLQKIRQFNSHLLRVAFCTPADYAVLHLCG